MSLLSVLTSVLLSSLMWSVPGVTIQLRRCKLASHHGWVGYRVTVLDGFSPISTLFVVKCRLEILFALSAGHVIYARPWE